MDDAESIAEWGERWLRDWCNEPGLSDDEREFRPRQAAVWREWTLESVMSQDGWFNPFIRLAKEHYVSAQVDEEVALYKGTLHALPVWRAFYIFRSEGRPVPEFILAKFEQWAGRLMRLHHEAKADNLDAEEGLAILRALQFVGDRKSHLSLRRLAGVEGRRRKASEIASLRRLRRPWKAIADRLALSEQAAKDLLYEFEPGPRRSKRKAPADELAAAHRRMVRK